MSTSEEQRAELALAYCLGKDKPIHQLLRETIKIGENRTAQLLGCYQEFVASLFPRFMPDGRLDSGWEPSGGFIGAALAILGANGQAEPRP